MSHCLVCGQYVAPGAYTHQTPEGEPCTGDFDPSLIAISVTQKEPSVVIRVGDRGPSLVRCPYDGGTS